MAESAERGAVGRSLTPDEVNEASRLAQVRWPWLEQYPDCWVPPYIEWLTTALTTPVHAAWQMAENLQGLGLPWAGREWKINQVRSHSTLVGVAECIHPVRPVVIDPRWRTADVLGLLAGIRQDRAYDRLPILADALMDAGCDDEQIIAHCRTLRPHVPGCWVTHHLELGRGADRPDPAGNQRIMEIVNGIVGAVDDFKRAGCQGGQSPLLGRIQGEMSAIRQPAERPGEPIGLRLWPLDGGGGWDFDGPFLAGTRPGLRLDLQTAGRGAASRLHALIWSDGRAWWVVDLQSTNGTWVNGRRVEQTPVGPLRSNDIVQFAHAAFRVAMVEGVGSGTGRGDSDSAP